MTIVASFSLVAVPTWLSNDWRIPLRSLIEVSRREVGRFGVALGASLIACHILFH